MIRFKYKYGLASQIIVILVFVSGMLLNYHLLSPIIWNEADVRVKGEMGIYLMDFIAYSHQAGTDTETLDSIYQVLEPYRPYHGKMYVIDGDNQFRFANTAAEGNAMDSIRQKFGERHVSLAYDERKTQSHYGTYTYDDDTWNCFYYKYDAPSDLLYFYEVDYSDTGDRAINALYLLLLAMIVGGLILIMISFWNMKKMSQRIINEKTMERQLELAANIQQAMLPKNEERHILFETDARLIPAKTIGGDLYYYLVRNGKLFFCIGDVSGKGVPASLYMSKAVSLFRLMARHIDSPASIAMKMNQEHCTKNEKNIFITAFIGVMRISDGQLTYCNAGHSNPLLWNGESNDAADYLVTKRNLPLGFDYDATYEEETITLHENAMLLLYTDGVNEAKRSKGNFYGTQRVQQVVDGVKGQNSHTINEALVTSVKAFLGLAEQNDDITMLTIRRIKKSITESITNNSKDLKRVTKLLKELFRELGLDGKQSIHIRSAFDEALTNCVRYAYDEPGQPIEVRIEINNGCIVFTIEDFGHPFNPLTYEPPQTEEISIGGLGIMMMKKNFDKMEYVRNDNKNILKLYKTI